MKQPFVMLCGMYTYVQAAMPWTVVCFGLMPIDLWVWGWEVDQKMRPKVPPGSSKRFYIMSYSVCIYGMPSGRSELTVMSLSVMTSIRFLAVAHTDVNHGRSLCHDLCVPDLSSQQPFVWNDVMRRTRNEGAHQFTVKMDDVCRDVKPSTDPNGINRVAFFVVGWLFQCDSTGSSPSSGLPRDHFACLLRLSSRREHNTKLPTISIHLDSTFSTVRHAVQSAPARSAQGAQTHSLGRRL